MKTGVEPRLGASYGLAHRGVFVFFTVFFFHERVYNVSGLKFIRELRETVDSYRRRDPAADSALEILLLYPGVRALRSYRRAHRYWERGHKLLARMISERAKRRTGIEIHPGAKIGRRLVIDHGSGIVIGETAEIGDDVLIYQGVTLGGTGKDHGKRHPTIGNNVLIGAGAKILGPFKVGDGSRVAAGAVVLQEVPPNATAVGVPARIVRIDGKKVAYTEEIDQVNVTDPTRAELAELRTRVEELAAMIETHKGE